MLNVVVFFSSLSSRQMNDHTLTRHNDELDLDMVPQPLSRSTSVVSQHDLPQPTRCLLMDAPKFDAVLAPTDLNESKDILRTELLAEPPTYLNAHNAFTASTSLPEFIEKTTSFVSRCGSLRRAPRNVSPLAGGAIVRGAEPSFVWDGHTSFDNGHCLDFQLHLWRKGEDIVFEVQRLSGDAYRFAEYQKSLFEFLVDTISIKRLSNASSVLKVADETIEKIHEPTAPSLLVPLLNCAISSSSIDHQRQTMALAASWSVDAVNSNDITDSIPLLHKLIHSPDTTVQRYTLALLANLSSKECDGHCTILPM